MEPGPAARRRSATGTRTTTSTSATATGWLELFARLGRNVGLVIHAAAQPSHDWAAREPFTDFDVNAVGTLNMLEAARQHCPKAPFIFTSTNKVYGDLPNSLPLIEHETRWELPEDHKWYGGIDETMSIDQCLHSVFGASKVAADVMVQEYGRYFDMPTAVFRGGTLTGPGHSAAELHGFLAYVMRCVMEQRHVPHLRLQGESMVRDAIHSHDLVSAFEAFFRAPRVAEVYNMGGGRASRTAASLEAFQIASEITGLEARTDYVEENRVGDHQWWISSTARFEEHYPDWSSPTTSRPSCARCTRPTRTSGRPADRFRPLDRCSRLPPLGPATL